MSRYAVVGHPVAHSQSPFIHAAFAAQTGEPVVYERLLCPLDGFAAAVREFAAGGASGCNVTMPFKFEACGLVPRTTPRARVAGACNVLRFDADGWLGDNTDGAGLVRDIERNAGIALRGARVLLIGAGGGAAGALGPLLASGASEVVVANRSVERAHALVERHRAAAGEAMARVVAAPLDACGVAFDVVVNATATSVAGAPVPVAASVLRRGGLALDMMYGPAASAFVAWAEANGASGRDGLGMLVEQAAEAFLLWRGVEPETAPVLCALRARLAAP
ncbi:MAG TPA: shikimate dehydrogenase [Caldimonas sp.]|jgi:shikimate dehydrogenase|nr:shikimate dehydrogenase [Caldimonas sp.]HEV7577089.1 shikimate dehydrogenase [Caldimonas sp.]